MYTLTFFYFLNFLFICGCLFLFWYSHSCCLVLGLVEGSCLLKDDKSRTNSGKAHNVDEGHSKRKPMGTQISKKTKFANELSYYLEFLILQPDHNGGFLRLWLVGCHCLCLWLFFAAKSGPKLGLTHKQRQCTRIVTDLPQI